MIRRFLTLGCMLLALLPALMAYHAEDGDDDIDTRGSARRLWIGWNRGGGGRLDVAWMLSTGVPAYGPRLEHIPVMPWAERGTYQARHQLGPFGCDLFLFPITQFGEIVVPLWSVSLMFMAYPTWRAYRWWRPKALPGKGAFEPVVT